MSYIYAFLIILLITYILTRKFDLLSLAGISHIIYTIHSVFGTVWIPKSSGYYYYENIAAKTYSMVIIQLLIIITFIFVNDNLKISTASIIDKATVSKYTVSKAKKYAFSFLLAFAVFFTLTNIGRFGTDIFHMNKKVIVSEMDVFYGLSVWSALVILAYSIDHNNKKMFFISSSIILINLFIGSRAYFATAVVILLTLKWKNVRNVIYSNFKVFFAGLMGISGLFIYKQIYKDIRQFAIGTVLTKLTDIETYAGAFQLDEPRIIMSIYNYVLSLNYRLEPMDSIARILSIFPLINDYIPVSKNLRFSSIIKNEIFKSTYGLASSFWAESYAMLGYFGIIFFTLAWLIVLKKGYNCLNASGSSKYFIIPGVAYLSFYIHRLDYLQIMGAFKSLLVIYFIWWMFIQLANVLMVSSNRRSYD